MSLDLTLTSGSTVHVTSENLPSLPDDIEVHYVNGLNLSSYPEMLKAIAQAMSFPDYFGHNADAFIDCLRDMTWSHARGHILVVKEAELASSDALNDLCELWQFAADDWHNSSSNLLHPLPAPFHLVLQGDKSSIPLLSQFPKEES